ncbi:MAG TPA: hypothetical protein VNJ54_11460 [Plantibacter sp.]|uniref:hypothetical protein n=1 Tax=Plantibacter sp. TaxID=1871045 RepID=UPI002C0F498E|nr:hypothetical protein [Plantibacter sp.]
MRVWISSRVSSACAAVVLAAVAVSADGLVQTPAPAGSRLIVRAVGADGQPVLDLKREEVSIRTDGKPREVRSLELVRFGGAPSAPAVAASLLAAPFATNTAGASASGDGREFIIAVDEQGMAPGREEPMRAALGQLFAALSPTDRIGILSMRMGGLNLPPTDQHESVRTALARLLAGGSTRESHNDFACRTLTIVQSLGGLMRGAPAGRTIVFYSPGLASPLAGGPQVRMGGSSALCQYRTNDLDELGVAAATSAANLYVLHGIEGLAPTALTAEANAGIEHIAGVANGEFIRLTGGNDASVRRIAKETSAYYIATLDSGPPDVRRVDAKSTRDGIRLQGRPAGAGGIRTASKDVSPRDMLRTTAPFGELSLRADGFVSREGTSDLKVVTLFEPIDPKVKVAAASVGIIDAKGTLKWQWSAQPADLARSPLAAASLVTPGKYRIRVAVVDNTGAAGAVDYELDARLADAPPIKMGSMLLGVSEQGKGFTPRIQFTATDAMAVGLVEIYGVPTGASVTARFEIAQTDAGPPLGQTPGTVGPGRGEDGRLVFGGFGTPTLAPGDYLMRVIISVDGKVAGTATRTLRKIP